MTGLISLSQSPPQIGIRRPVVERQVDLHSETVGNVVAAAVAYSSRASSRKAPPELKSLRSVTLKPG
jgi:hypothetical protein